MKKTIPGPVQRTHTNFGSESKNTQNAVRILNICERLRLESGTPTILDIGCGAGHVVILAARRGLQAIGIEPDPITLKIGQRQAQDESLKVQFVLGTGDILNSMENQSVDIVIMKDVLEHVPDYQRLLQNSRRILRDGGIIYIATTNKFCPLNLEVAYIPLYSWYPSAVKRILLTFIMRYWRAAVRYTSTPAVNWFTRGSLRRALINAGFTEVLDVYDFYQDKNDLTQRTQVVAPLIVMGRRVRYIRPLIDFVLPSTFMVGQVY